ncbi:putative intraflagellar transport protein 74/72 [Toxoplasma gondii VAND]|uniref:Putative intraflagellar transport protein 74/72 n=1 Tax=Toxoplasma gondii VAND TaxID=933077 RepID=A0A086PHI5_TOXGO|nr:putative intraflagellar transport protein 74/72 [Toxoplasma gondii VAND]
MAGIGSVGKENPPFFACTSSERPVTGHRGGFACPEILEPRGLLVSGSSRAVSLRQVADPTYFFILLKEKHRDLRREIGKFQAQIEVLSREAEQLPMMRRRKRELEKDIEELQEEIAVINSAVTLGRENLRPEVVAATAREVKEKNETKRALLDELFVSNWTRAARLSSLNAELNVLTDACEEKLLRLSPETRRTYEDLQQKLEHHQAEMKRTRQIVESLSEELSAAEEKVQSDPARTRLLQLRETHDTLRRCQEGNLHSRRVRQRRTLAENRAAILQEIEKLTGEISDLQKKQKRSVDLTRSQTEREAEIRVALSRRLPEEDEQEQQKLRLLAEKDAELSAFIERYSKGEGREKRSATQAAGEAELSEAEKLNSLLEEQLRAVPMPEQAETLARALNETKTALQKAEQDLLEAKSQLEEKQKELYREENMEAISKEELRVVCKHLEDMRGEIAEKLDKADDLRRLTEEEQNQLTHAEKHLRGNLEEVRAATEAATNKKNEAMNRLRENSVHQRLADLEAELERTRRSVEIVQKDVDLQKQIDPNAVTASCMGVVEKINEQLKVQTQKCHWHQCRKTPHNVDMSSKLSHAGFTPDGNRKNATGIDVV